ncbi:MAG TPA: hypothetical protein VHU41_02760 [Thermoanaerobaculia bacterium]|nr:hypothetical protein [Thermoanaerobaculia bacterium]
MDRVDAEEADDSFRVDPLGVDSERLIAGMHLPQLVRSASVEKDGTIVFHLDRGGILVTLLGREGFDRLLLQRIPDDVWRAARAYAGGDITQDELVQYVSASSKRR